MAKSLPHLQKTPTWWTWRDQDHRGSLTALHLLQYCRQNSWSLHTGCTCVLCWISAALGGPNSVAGTAKESNSIKNKQNLILLPKDLSILKRNVQIQWVTSYLRGKKAEPRDVPSLPGFFPQSVWMQFHGTWRERLCWFHLGPRCSHCHLAQPGPNPGSWGACKSQGWEATQHLRNKDDRSKCGLH